jgi:hypothetical protein
VTFGQKQTVPPGSGDTPEAVRERRAQIHDDAMRRERLLAEHRRQAGSATPDLPGAAMPGLPGPFNPGGGFQSGFNRE